MSVFGDTSAFYALLVRTDKAHTGVRAAFADLLARDRRIWTTSFVIVETMALLQHRIGLAAARDFHEDILPVLEVEWVDDDLYHRGVERLWREDRRHVTLVDCVAFEFMKRQGLTAALTIDPHFTAAGFAVLPESSR